jgi:hypothetical protein
VSDDLRLNSLDRFRKQSPRLVLEEHGHCEVPAGCGGVVLRWRNPFASRLFNLAFFTPGSATLWLDGAEPESGLIDLAVGPHVVAVKYPGMVRGNGLLMFALVSHDKARAKAAVAEPTLTVRSAAGPAWKFTTEEPADDGWQKPGYSTAAWTPLVKVAAPEYKPGSSKYGLYQCTEAKAHALGLPPRTTGRGVWVRHEFTIPVPEAEA